MLPVQPLFAMPEESSPIVVTTEGRIQGVGISGMSVFRGIPYATPPVGKLRWMPPQAIVPWAGIRQAREYSPVCAAQDPLGGFGQIGTNEDCLYLNVYGPADISQPKNKYPVMVWIHGGGLATGSGNDYDVSDLVSQGVIVVTFNYRLGMFGFFSHPAVNNESHQIINYGLLDQQAVLQWVKRNIGRFGGDKDNVTLFGESAGGHSVLAQLVSPGAKGLFNKAIVQSGSYSLVQPTIAEMDQYGYEVARITGCNQIIKEKISDCMRAAKASLIIEKGPNFLPVAQVAVDGAIIPESFRDAFTTGRFNHVPVINGFNSNEGTFFAGLMEKKAARKFTAEDFLHGLQIFLGEKEGVKAFRLAEKMVLINPDENLGASFASFFGRVKFICPVPVVNRMLSAFVPVYSYEFADTDAPALLDKVSFSYRAAHTAELQYIFKGFYGVQGNKSKLNQRQVELSAAMVSYWTTFAKNGAPNRASLPFWEPYVDSQDNALLLIPEGARMINGITDKYDCKDISRIIP